MSCRGEFFGIVGRNGSGKSTLLKVLASIYQADSGRVRMAGTLAPFIELGVGFNTELTAEENIVLNGVMMGLTRGQAQARIGTVLEFAELEEFVDMKLKNYSSGMLVRLAFSIMLQADTDILLIDEVLAVGDAAFQQKCADVFKQMRDSGRTVILVTHDMRSVDKYCHRALLLNDGRIESIGDPHEVGRRYLQPQLRGGGGRARDRARPHQGGDGRGIGGSPGRRLAGRARTARGSSTSSRARRSGFNAIIEARREIVAPTVGFSFADANGVDVFALERESGGPRPLLEKLSGGRAGAGRPAPFPTASPAADTTSAAGSGATTTPSDVAMHVPHALDFVVYGRRDVAGLVDLDHQLEAEIVTEAPEER